MSPEYTIQDAISALEVEKMRNAVLFSALYELVEAIDSNSGAEPSVSVYDRALDRAKELIFYRGGAREQG